MIWPAGVCDVTRVRNFIPPAILPGVFFRYLSDLLAFKRSLQLV